MLKLSPAEAHFFIYTRDRIIFEDRKHDYELMRHQTFLLLSPYLDSKSRIKKPSDLITFEWESNNQAQINPADFTEDAFQLAEKKYLGTFIDPNITL